MKYVIIHGTFGSPDENWFPWLKDELEKNGHEVWIPHFSTPEQQTPEVWCAELQQQVPFVFDCETVLVGHSLGATYLLHILDAERKEPIHKAVFVAGFVHTLGNKLFDSLNKPFLEKEFNRERIKSNVSNVVILYGDNDPYVPFTEAELLHEKLGGTLITIPCGGHLNTAAGYETFPELLEVV